MKTIFSSLLLSVLIGLSASGCGGGGSGGGAGGGSGSGSGSSTPVPPVATGGDTGTVVTPPTTGALANWTTRINNSPLLAMASSPSLSVAVGKGGFTKTSVNGTEWTVGATGTTKDLRAIAWSGSRFVTVGDAGTILSSADGVHWSASVSGSSARLAGVTWSASTSLFVAVGGDGGTKPAVILTSPDGLAWSSRSAGTNLPLVSLTWTGSQFVAVSSGNVVNSAVSLTSPNGIDWTVHATPVVCFNSVTSSNGQIVGVGSQQIYSSSDGVTWTSRVPFGTDEEPWSVTWSGSQFVVVGGQIESVIYTSADGIGWASQASLTTNNFGSIRGVSWSGRQFIAAADGGNIITSADGVTWAKQSPGASRSMRAVTWTGSQYVAVGADHSPDQIFGAAVFTSPDAITWTPHRFTDVTEFVAVAHSPTRLVATGAFGEISTSTDGISWTSVNANASGYALNSVIWAGNQFVAVGGYSGSSQPIVATSPDGIHWTMRDLPAEWSSILHGVAWNGSQFVAVGWSGTILTSPDAVTWSLQPKMTLYEQYSDVVWAGGQFVAAGKAGSIVTSSDGVTWTKREEPGTGYSYERLTWTGKQFVAVGGQSAGAGSGAGSDPTLNIGIIRTSPDGVTWTTQVNGGINYLFGVAASNDKAVAVGVYGLVLTSP